MYTLEERVEQPESLETKKKKKKKKKKAKPENETADETIDRTTIDKNSSSLPSSNEVFNSPTNKSCDGEEETISMEIDSSGLHIASTTQPVTEFQEVKPQVSLAMVCKDVISTEYYITGGNSVCDFPIDTSDEESSMPSARALSVALQTSVIPFGDAEGSLLAEDETDADGKCYLDVRDSKVNIGPVLKTIDSDSQTMKPESIHLTCTSEFDDGKDISECTVSVGEVEVLDEEEAIQTQQCDLVKVIKQEAFNENILLRHTDGENNSERFGNFNNLNVSLSRTDEPSFVTSAKERDFSVPEESSVSVPTYNVVKTSHESSKEHCGSEGVTHCSKSVELSVDVEENVVIVDDSRLENKNNGIRLGEEQNQLQNERERSEHFAGSNNFPLIELEGLEFGEGENCVDEQTQSNDECVTYSKEVEESLDRSGGEATVDDVLSLFESESVLSKVDESFGVKCTTEEEEKNEVARHVEVKSDCTEEKVENGNQTLNVNGMTQVQSEGMTCDVDVKTGSMDACVEHNSVTYDRSSAMEQVSNQMGSVSQVELNTADPVKAQNENINRPAGNCGNTRTVERLEGREHEATEIAVSELSNSTKADDGLADKETSLFNFQETTPAFRLGEGSQVSVNCEKVDTHSSSCATAETNETTNMHLPSFSTSSSIDLQTDSSFSLSCTKQDLPFCPSEETKGTSVALDVATESCVKEHMSSSTLDEVSEDVDINQHATEDAVAGTQQAPVIATSNCDIPSEEGKRSDHTCISLEHSASVSGEHVKTTDLEQNLSPPIHEQTEEILAKEQIRTSQTGQIETQFNEAEVVHDLSGRNKDIKPDGDESLDSQQNHYRSSSPHEDSAGNFVHVDNKRDTITSPCEVENLPEKENYLNIVSKMLASNSTSETSTMKHEGKGIPSMHGTELTCDNLKTEEQTKGEAGVPMTNRIDESKQGVDDEKEDGEISSDEDDTLKTQKPAEKEREEGELSSSDSDVEAHGEVSSHEQQGGASLLRSYLTDGKNVFSRKEKWLCSTRQHSSSGLPQYLSEERGRVPENTGSNRRASLSSFKSTDLRAKLSEARKTRPLLKGRSTGIRDTRDGRVRETRPVEKRTKKNDTAEKCSVTSENEKGPRQGKSVRGTSKDGNKTKVKSSKLQDSSLVKRRETRQRVTETSDEGRPGSNQGRDETKGNRPMSEKKVKGKSHSSLRGGDAKVKKTNPVSSRHKIENKSHLDPEKITKKSTDLRVTEDKKNTRKSRSFQGHKTEVKGKESKIELETSVTKTTSGCKGETKKMATDSHTVSRTPSQTCSHVTKEKVKLNPSAKVSLRGNKTNKHPSESSIGSSQQPHSESETTAKKATVLTNHSKGDNKNDKGSKMASSQGKVQNKAGKRSKAKDETKAMDGSVVVKRGCSAKGKPTRVKTTIKVSPRITPRKALKKLPSNITSKAKVQPQHENKDRTGNPSKRPRAIAITEVREAKRLRLEEENDSCSKLPKDSSTTEISKPSAKGGEYISNRENLPPPCKLNVSENKIIPASDKKLKSADEYTCLDNSKKSTNEIDRTLSNTLFIGHNKRLVFKHRHVNQLFIRGDNVVMVAYAK